MSEPPGREKSLAAKLLTICAVGVLISLGMCGLASQMKGSWESARSVFGIAGGLVFIFCMLACLALLLIIGVGALVRKL